MFGNLLNTITQGIKGATGYLANIGSSLFGSKPQQPSFGPPNVSTPYGPGYADLSGNIYVQTQAGAVNIKNISPYTSNLVQKGTGPVIVEATPGQPLKTIVPSQNYYQPAITPQKTTTTTPTSTFSTPTPVSYSTPNSSPSISLPPPPPGYHYEGTRLVPNPQAPSGTPGASASYIPTYTPQAPSGTSGLGGISSHTGLLGGVQAGISLTPVSSTEEEKNKTYTIKPGDTLSKIAKQLGVSLEDIIRVNPQITNPNLIKVGQTINIPSTSVETTSRVSLPQIVSPGGVVNLGLVQEGINRVKELLKSPLSQQTISDLNNYLENTKQILYQAQAKLNPALNMPEPMPVPPQEGIQKEGPSFVAKWEEIARKYDLPNQIKQIEDMRTKILAESQAYDIIIKDIQNDPDFPKRLAQKKINAIQKARDTNLKALELQLNFLVDNYNQRLNMAKYEAGLYQEEYRAGQTALERERRARERAIDNNRAMLQQMISTGALGDLTDAELQQWANATGYTLESLKAMRKAVKTGNELKIAQARANLERTQALTEKTLSSPRGDKLTISEAKSLGLPLSLVGRSEAEVLNEINSPNPPSWFKDMIEQKLQASVSDNYLIQKWREFKDAFNKTQSSGGSSGGLSESDIEKLLNL
jgi:LysM repeat protein